MVEEDGVRRRIFTTGLVEVNTEPFNGFQVPLGPVQVRGNSVKGWVMDAIKDIFTGMMWYKVYWSCPFVSAWIHQEDIFIEFKHGLPRRKD